MVCYANRKCNPHLFQHLQFVQSVQILPNSSSNSTSQQQTQAAHKAETGSLFSFVLPQLWNELTLESLRDNMIYSKLKTSCLVI